jgi:hypothetical protein
MLEIDLFCCVLVRVVRTLPIQMIQLCIMIFANKYEFICRSVYFIAVSTFGESTRSRLLRFASND